MAKPTSKPDWTLGNPSFGTVTIEPSAGKKQTGWTSGERPPFQTMNWLLFNIGTEWIDYLEEVTDGLVNLQGVFDAVVGTGGDFATLQDLFTDAEWLAGNIKNVLVTSDQTISAPLTIDQDDVNIEFKPGVNVLKGIGTTRAFIVDANRTRITKGRFANFADPGDAAIELAATANYPMIMENYFLNNDTAVLDSGATAPVVANNIDEV
jgi:hypothetical protein